MMRRHRHPTGFTLVELLLVILLLSSLAFTATAFVDNAGQQMGFDQTKSRLEQIRRAIIGDTSRTINGQPELSGFVADMGRLPENLSELIEPISTQLWDSEDITLNSVVVGQLYGGWRGPYLDAMPESSGTRAFRDGWGNQNEDSGEDGENYGWVFTLKKADDTAAANIGEAARIFVQSLGADFAAGQADAANPYHQDYPVAGQNLIQENDWRVDISSQTIPVQINRLTTTADTLELHLFRLQDRSLQSIPSIPVVTQAGVTNQVINASFAADTHLPMGTYAAVVVCSQTPPALPYPYSGDCATAGTAPPTQYFSVIPRSYQPTLQQITWNTQ